MITFSQIAVVILLFIVLLMALAKNPICFSFLDSEFRDSEFQSEAFDTYYNHDMRAHTVHQGGRFGGNPNISIGDSDLKKRYDWANRDPQGLNIFDDVYESLVHEKNAGFEREYDYQETSEEPYDEKFNNVPNSRGYDPSQMWDGIEERTYYHPSAGRDPTKRWVAGGLDYRSDRPDTEVLGDGFDVFLSQKGKN
jgi:hypothetical protein